MREGTRSTEAENEDDVSCDEEDDVSNDEDDVSCDADDDVSKPPSVLCVGVVRREVSR